jgi:hypothetical protein
MAVVSQTDIFRLVLIKPSRYDDDGYVIQWVRSYIPSNTLAALNGLALDCAKRKILGEHVEICIETYDETNTILPLKHIIQSIKQSSGGMVGLVGVQSNQFPHAVDLADRFLKADIPVVIGGFHVSGCLAMLPEIPGDIQAAMDKGITMFAGEAEEHLEDILRDAFVGQLKPVYNFMDDLPNLEGIPSPLLPAKIIKNTLGLLSSFDAGRGCPFQCSFCTIINVQGRKSRWRSPDDIEKLIRENLKQGIRRFFITDDDFARNKNWEPILDRCIKMREEEGLQIRFTIQVDTLCHKIPRFIEKCARAGARSVFIGLENINPDSLVGAKKRQNKISEYRKMIQMWKDHKCMTVAGYILGFPADTPETIARDIEIIQRELPIDCLEFFCLTPLPGSEDHKNLYEQGVSMDPDMNKYDLEHVTTSHPLMSKEEWQEAYHMAWKTYYSLDHVETVLRRVASKGQKVDKVMSVMLRFHGCISLEGIHPLEGGMFRRKVRTTRRAGLPLENPIFFYPRGVWEMVSSTFQWAILYWQFRQIANRVKTDPHRREYTDLAITPVLEEEEEDLTIMKIHSAHIPVANIAKSKVLQSS